MKVLINLLVVCLPWCVRKFILQYFYGYAIGKKTKIGFSYIFPKQLIMEDGSSIGNLNVAINLDFISIGSNSTIGRLNWITGFPCNTGSKHFSHEKIRRSELIIAEESAITKNHHIDCTNSITIGKFVTIAGYSSQLLTHSIDVYEGRQDSHPIKIGDYCFISSGVKILGGSILPSFSVLAAGAVLNKKYEKEWTLYAGVPAKPIKDIDREAKYFCRTKGFVY